MESAQWQFNIDAQHARVDLASMGKNQKNLLLIAVLIMVIAIVGALLALWNPSMPAPATLPMPNGYSSFVDAATLVERRTSDFSTMDQQDLRDTVEANSNALQIARTGLGEKVQVPMEFSVAYSARHAPQLLELKLLAQAFLAEGRLAEMDQRTNAAANAYLDATRLGVECRRGGPLIDNLIGLAIESMGTTHLQSFAGKLDAKTSGELAREIETLDAQRETWPQVLQNERDWSRRAFPGFRYRIATFFASSKLKAARAKTGQRFNAQTEKTRRLMVDLAAHAYEMEKGRPPGSIADLVPNYLKAVPQDPAAGKAMTLNP
jgi:hypothetical protein